MKQYGKCGESRSRRRNREKDGKESAFAVCFSAETVRSVVHSGLDDANYRDMCSRRGSWLILSHTVGKMFAVLGGLLLTASIYAAVHVLPTPAVLCFLYDPCSLVHERGLLTAVERSSNVLLGVRLGRTCQFFPFEYRNSRSHNSAFQVLL
jgi:hypothetical protein